MRLKLIRVGKHSFGGFPYKYKDWAVELCIVIWLGAMLLGEHLGWEQTPWWMYIADFIIVDIAFYRFKRMLPRRCWRSMIYYSLYCAAAFMIGYTIVYFRNPDYLITDYEWVKALIIIAIFLAAATFGVVMWYRRIQWYKAILQERMLRIGRRKTAY